MTAMTEADPLALVHQLQGLLEELAEDVGPGGVNALRAAQDTAERLAVSVVPPSSTPVEDPRDGFWSLVAKPQPAVVLDRVIRAAKLQRHEAERQLCSPLDFAGSAKAVAARDKADAVLAFIRSAEMSATAPRYHDPEVDADRRTVRALGGAAGVPGLSGTPLADRAERDWYPLIRRPLLSVHDAVELRVATTSPEFDAWTNATGADRLPRQQSALLSLADEYTRLTGEPPPFLVPIEARIFAPTASYSSPPPRWRPRLHPVEALEARDILLTMQEDEIRRRIEQALPFEFKGHFFGADVERWQREWAELHPHTWSHFSDGSVRAADPKDALKGYPRHHLFSDQPNPQSLEPRGARSTGGSFASRAGAFKIGEGGPNDGGAS